MTIWHYVLIVAGGLAVVFLACLKPERFWHVISRLAINALAGAALLVGLNLLGLSLPLNVFTLAVGSLLGVPGVAAVAVIAAI